MYNAILPIVFNKEVIEQYERYYFKKYPRRNKKPLRSPVPPSLNAFTAMIRVAQNAVKQQWKEFVLWYIQYILDLKDVKLPITNCDIDLHYTFPTKARHDADNYCLGMKFIGDGLVEGGVLEDDSLFVVQKLTISGSYSKNNPSTTIHIKYCR